MSADRDSLEWQYNPRVTVGDPTPFFRRNAELSEQARAERRALADQRYGPGPNELADVFPAAEPGAPVHVFFHGGYWRSQDKGDYAFVAGALAARGITTVVANYDLCPAVRIGDIVAEARRCVAWVRQNAAGWGADPARLTVSGHSAGGQLVARVLTDPGQPEPVTRAVSFSGVFDLRPLVSTTVNEAIGMDEAEAARNSPLLDAAPGAGVDLWLLVGGDEPEAFHAQSHDYARHCTEAGARTRVEAVPGTNHFTVLTACFVDDQSRADAIAAFCREP